MTTAELFAPAEFERFSVKDRHPVIHTALKTKFPGLLGWMTSQQSPDHTLGTLDGEIPLSVESFKPPQDFPYTLPDTQIQGTDILFQADPYPNKTRVSIGLNHDTCFSIIKYDSELPHTFIDSVAGALSNYFKIIDSNRTQKKVLMNRLYSSDVDEEKNEISIEIDKLTPSFPQILFERHFGRDWQNKIEKINLDISSISHLVKNLVAPISVDMGIRSYPINKTTSTFITQTAIIGSKIESLGAILQIIDEAEKGGEIELTRSMKFFEIFARDKDLEIILPDIEEYPDFKMPARLAIDLIDVIDNASPLNVKRKNITPKFEIRVETINAQDANPGIEFSFLNNGEPINPQLQDENGTFNQLLTQGTTTKGDGHGHGLYHLDQTVRELGGAVRIVSPINEPEFTTAVIVFLPKEKLNVTNNSLITPEEP